MFEDLPWQFTFTRISYFYFLFLFVVYCVLAFAYVRTSPSHRWSILLPFSPTFSTIYYISANSTFAILALNSYSSFVYIFLLALAYLFSSQFESLTILPAIILKSLDNRLFSIDSILSLRSAILLVSSISFIAYLPKAVACGLFKFNSDDKVLKTFGGFDFVGTLIGQLFLISLVVFILSISLGRSQFSSPLSIFYVIASLSYFLVSAAASGSKGAILLIATPIWLIFPFLNFPIGLVLGRLYSNLRISKLAILMVISVSILALIYIVFISPETFILLPYLAGYFIASPIECQSAVSFDHLRVLGGILPYNFNDILLEPFHKFGISVQIDPGNAINLASSVLPHTLNGGTNDSLFCYAYQADTANLLLISLLSFAFIFVYMACLRTYYASLQSISGSTKYSYASLFFILHGTPFSGWTTYLVPFLRDFFCSVLVFSILRIIAQIRKPCNSHAIQRF
jgi:hypothetical protein